MPKAIPPVLKPITPYVQRAEEMRKANTETSRVMAFFCGKYAMELGMSLSDKSAEVKAFLLDLMNELESGKVKMDDAAARTAVEEFAMSVFQRADDTDRAGRADKSTAQSFYAAATFFEILKQFSPTRELDDDVRQTQLYAKWKATDIIKAIKEGRKPTPGGPGEQSALTTDHSEEDHERSAASVAPPPPPSSTQPPEAAPPPAPPSNLALGRPLDTLSKARREDILEYLRFAKVAVEKDIVDIAIVKLESALRLLHAD